MHRLTNKSAYSFTVLFACLSLSVISVAHSKDLLHVLVHHVGDADCRNYFEEVGGDAAVQTRYPFMRYDVFELAHHSQLGFTLSDG